MHTSHAIPAQMHHLVVVPLANHVLKQATDTTLAAQLPTYQNPTMPIMPEVVSAIAEWILKPGR